MDLAEIYDTSSHIASRITSFSLIVRWICSFSNLSSKSMLVMGKMVTTVLDTQNTTRAMYSLYLQYGKGDYI